MGNDTKWADVAHYYAFSGIMGKLNWGPNSINLPLDKPQDAALIHDRLDHIRSGQIVFVPILRHLEDMTEAEARGIWQIHFGKPYEKGPFNELEEPCKDEILNSATYGTRNRLNTELMLGNSLTLHWFISRGFDVFGLIESGQAIRKEVGNGNI